jgi:hypothetical protein
MWVEKAPAHPLFSVNAHYDLKWFSPPNIIRTLVPAVTAALKNTAPAFSLSKNLGLLTTLPQYGYTAKFHF